MKLSVRNENKKSAKSLFTLILIFMLVLPLVGWASCGNGDEEDGKSFIWKITSDNCHVYLLGSIHIASPDIYPLDDDIENAFLESEKLVVEINIKEVGPITTMMLFEKYGTYPYGEGLRENLDEDLYERLEKSFEEMGMSLDAYDDYRPWVIVTLMEETVLTEGDYSARYGIDLHFLEKAIERDMEILELETSEYQLQIMSDFPDELMILMIEMSLEPPDMDDYIDIFGYIIAQWEKGNAEGIEEVLFKDLEEEPALAPYYDVMFNERNYNMQIKIEEYLADEYIYYIVVGAGHLVGEEGLVNLLEEAGYIVEQLGD